MRRLPGLLAIFLVPALVTLLARAGDVTTSRDQNGPVDRVLVNKSNRTLTLMTGDKVVKQYSVALGSQPIGHKERQGDGRTPEGRYVIDSRKPDSQFHLALHISYPNAEDRARATQLKVDPGGDIMIHGLKTGLGWLGRLHRMRDWTQGCIAVTNDEIEEIWRLVPDGTAVEIVR